MEAVPLVAEERISFGLHVASSSTTNVADIRNMYNEVDSRLIAKEVCLLTFHLLSPFGIMISWLALVFSDSTNVNSCLYELQTVCIDRYTQKCFPLHLLKYPTASHPLASTETKPFISNCSEDKVGVLHSSQ